MPPQKFFDELARIAKRFGMLLIFDEVQSGMGRTGKMWAADHFDAAPDILAVAKGIASGLPLGDRGAGGADELAAGRACLHFRRKSGGVCGRGLVTDRTAGTGTDGNAARMGAYMMDRLRDWPARFPIVGDVRGLGLMIGIELVRDQETREGRPGSGRACSSWRSSAAC